MMEKAPGPPLRFWKMHGAGNDFVMIDRRGQSGAPSAAWLRALADRHRGIGFDQFVLLSGGGTPGLSLRFWNADGSEAGACGNATRCVAAFVMAETGAEKLSLRSPRGVLQAEKGPDGQIWVNMGAPIFDPALIPLAPGADPAALPLPGAPLALSMGNPHCVFIVEDAEAEDCATRGPAVEHDPLFPQRCNVGFASVTGPDALRLRVWERGAGLTLACGSGACAAAVAAHLRGLIGRRAQIRVDGGLLATDWRDDGVWLTGPTATVFTGTLAPEFAAAFP